jgi:hypothetical protein
MVSVEGPCQLSDLVPFGCHSRLNFQSCSACLHDISFVLRFRGGTYIDENDG